jgi:hypothetical protein
LRKWETSNLILVYRETQKEFVALSEEFVRMPATHYTLGELKRIRSENR